MKASGSRDLGSSSSRAFCIGLVYTIGLDLRYLSHHDEMRMLRRALVRAGWPLRYSQGFNPAPRLRLLLPRSVGMASDCQLATVELREVRPVTELGPSLSAALPHGCFLRSVFPVSQVVARPLRVRYRIELEQRELALLADRVRGGHLQLGQAQGPSNGSRRYVDELLIDGQALRVGLRYADGRTKRLNELMAELGLDPAAGMSRVRRVEVEWDGELAAIPPGAPAHGVQDAAVEKGSGFGNCKDSTVQEVFKSQEG